MKIKFGHWLLALIIAISIIFIFTRINKKAGSEEQDVIVAGTAANFPPFEFKQDGELTGFDVDLMQALAQRLHKKLVWKDIDFTNLLLEAQMGQIHVIASALTPTPERAQQVLFLPTYLEHDPLIVITRKDAPAPKSLADLKGKEVIVNDGYTAEAFMQQQEGVTLKRIGSVAEAFLALNAGRGDAFVSARSATQAFFDRMGSANYNILPLEKDETYAIAVSKQHAALHAALKKVYAQLEKDGTLQALKEKWHLVW